jgi:DNA-binding CsgD family transcriptional regulator
VEVFGREEEITTVRAFLERAADHPAALVLEGEAGIGKSTLWGAGVAAARERGLRILLSRPAEAERGLAHAGLGDLFDDVLNEVLPALTPPRRRALEIALLVEEADEPADPRALGVAVRTALQHLAGEGTVVLAVDDVQWLDPSSANALEFALRRLGEEPVLLLLARRVDPATRPRELEWAIGREEVERQRVGPLSLGAIHRLLQAQLGRTFARPTLLRVHEASGGNPFYALELARALGPVVDPMQPLPVPDTLEELLRARLGGLPDPTREALVLVSAVGQPAWALLQDAGVTEEVLQPALDARVIDRPDGVVRFAHPLLASVVYQGLPERERRRVHGRLADLVAEPLARARHRALSTEGPNAEVAGALDEAAALASGRGAPVVAAELGEHALRLTPPSAPEDHRRRTIAAARAHLAAGEAERARTLGRALEEGGLVGSGRADALVFLSELEPGQMQQRIALRREALLDASAPPELRLLIHQRLAFEVRFTEGVRAAEKHARAAVELAEQLDDDSLRAGALAALAMIRFTAGKRDALRLAERAHELGNAAQDPDRLTEARFVLSHILVWSVELGRARALLDLFHREWSERDERVSAQALWYLSLVELRAGRWSLAGEHAERAREISVQYGRDETEDPQNLFPIALLAAHRGELERSRDLAQLGRQLADGQGALLPGLAATSGLVSVWSGDAAGAIEHFAAAERMAESAGWLEPSLCWWRDEFVEALLELGRIDEAEEILDAWQSGARRLRREWVLARAARCRALVAAARGDVEQAVSLLEQAVEWHQAVSDPFGRARALLALGVARRRVRRRRAARMAIEDALAGFERCGATDWAENARAELGRIGGRAREFGLTPAERRVAALVAEGRTNREVAAALFLGERTVESHLSHIYAKLGIRSRTELARTLR